jgi:poly(beta-D-mannuronate) lyase
VSRAVGAVLGAWLVTLSYPVPAADWPVTDAASLATALKQATPGDTLTMRDGRWTDQKLVFRANGTAERPITLRAQTPGKVILDGTSVLRLGGAHLVVEGLWFQDGRAKEDLVEFRTHSATPATNCVLRDCAITATNLVPGQAENRWVSLYGVSNCIERCYLAGKRNRGTTLVVWVDTNRPNHHVLAHNHFGPRPRLGKNGGETIRVGDSAASMSSSRTLVASNFFDRCNGEVEIVSNKSCDNEYRANTFVACEGALTLRHGNRCRVIGNFFLGQAAPQTGGIRVIGEDHVVEGNYLADLRGEDARSAFTLMNGVANSKLNGYFRVQRARIAGNVIVDCERSIHLGLSDGGGKLPPLDCVFTGNLVRGKHAPLVKIETPPENLRWENNVMYGAKVGVESPGIRVEELQLARDGDGVWRMRGGPVIAGRPLRVEEAGPAWMPASARP